MSVFTKVLFVVAPLVAIAGYLVGWVIPLVDGRSAAFAIERATGQIKIRTDVFKNSSVPGYAQEWLAAGHMWMTVAYVLLGVAALLFVIAIVAAFMNLSDQNHKLKAAAKAA